jgi:hypothetical protein
MKRSTIALAALTLISTSTAAMAANPHIGTPANRAFHLNPLNETPTTANRAYYTNRAPQAAATSPTAAGYIIGVPNYGGYGYQLYSYPSYGYRNYGYTSRGRYVPNYSGYGYGYGAPVITDARAFGFANPF